MTPSEQEAFVNAYDEHVGDVSKQRVAAILDVWYSDPSTIETSLMVTPAEYTSIMDALGMWLEAAKWQLKNSACQTV